MMSHHGYQPSLQSSLPLAGTMELSIETLTGLAFELTVSPLDTIVSIKAKIQRVEGIPISHQHLIFNFQELDDSNCLMDYAIHNGATLTLVLSMRGGPISTRRLPVQDDMAWRELRDYVESNREDVWERVPPGSRVTVLVFREGDQVNFFKVIENEDGTYSPLSDSWSGSSIRNLFAEEDPEETERRLQENSVTMGKLHDLRQQMEKLALQKKPKKPVRVLSGKRALQRATARHSPRSKPKSPKDIWKTNQLPPINTGSQTTAPKVTNSNGYLAASSLLHQQQQRRPGVGPPTTRFSRHATNQPLPVVKQGPDPKKVRDTRRNGARAPPVPLRRAPTQTRISADVSALTSLPDIGDRRYSAYRRTLGKLSGHHVVDKPDIKSAISAAEPVKKSEQKSEQVQNASSISPSVRIEEENKAETTDLGYLKPELTENKSDEISDRLASSLNSGLRNRHQLLSHFIFDDRPKTSPDKLCVVGPNGSHDPISQQFLSRSVDQRAHEICEILSEAKRRHHRSQEQLKLNEITGNGFEFLKKSEASVSKPNESETLNGVFSRKVSLTESEVSARSARYGRRSMAPAGVNIESLQDVVKMQEVNIISRDDKKLEARLQRRLSASRQGRLHSAHKLLSTTKKTSRTRCSECNKKLNISNHYSCRCEKLFCAAHRYAEAHRCTFDYKTEGRKLLQQANPLITAPKLPKI